MNAVFNHRAKSSSGIGISLEIVPFALTRKCVFLELSVYVQASFVLVAQASGVNRVVARVSIVNEDADAGGVHRLAAQDTKSFFHECHRQ